MNIEIESRNRKAAANSTLPAAKLHVLQLEPIKEKIGDRWPRMSLLVHSLFEKALRHAQGPQDHFMKVGELSYVVTFHGSTPEEAGKFLEDEIVKWGAVIKKANVKPE